MHIRRVCFVGSKTEHLDAMADFARDVLGLGAGYRDDGWAVFRLESGDRDYLEIYRPGAYDERLLPASAGEVTIAFSVDDLLQARAELEAAGVEIVTDVAWAAEIFGDPQFEGFGWFCFRAPDGHVYAMQQDRRPTAGGERGGG